jgi:GNAT superfamily N-acetyltransferase
MAAFIGKEMAMIIGKDLTLTQSPRSAEIGAYDWFDVDFAGTQVGKSRCRIEPDRLTVLSIMIYPEFERKGFATAVVDHFKQERACIVADRVRFTARGFWTKVGFAPESEDRYVWHR